VYQKSIYGKIVQCQEKGERETEERKKEVLLRIREKVTFQREAAREMGAGKLIASALILE
jgi:hypothetical protein